MLCKKISAALAAAALASSALWGAENQPAGGETMKKEIARLFPKAELLKEDAVEQQYWVSTGKNRFWLAVPAAGKKLADLRMVCVFAGRGGSGKANNLSGEGIPGQCRREMLQAGLAFLCAECSPNAWGDPESTAATVAALEYCRKQGLNLPEKIDLLGFSMGGLGALMFAARRPETVRKVVDIFGITDLDDFYNRGFYRAMLSRIPEAERRDRSPCAKAERYKNMEILIVHGDRDATVDISYSKRFLELMQKQNTPCRLIVVPGIGHSNDILEKSGAAIRDFLAE